ncbi:late embryogenesis abundant protein At5g17165 [Brassica rapa]|uniref:Late embryogenesis abundant protein At5g17165-like n=2 Tax=Brassica TaxID=3705 RepID=A0A3P6DP14_BRACM|nr:late embryogenesis abundant protein At5g17165 [Brassica rapa]XP_048636212.1 late embryogenesis abundant protein At5g17165-like [Brassica napus]CAF2103538.1 unnamed protein product [Brassica napus]CAG7878485.1 unnamed protein product [Brassica rapa]CDY43147.1 BnaA05g32390D [Brassica napus]VDD25341.1 unnamed protein product [Brassica rapa]
MATRSKSFQLITGLRKLAVIPRASSRATATALLTSRSGHSSGYDKNVEDELQATAVPDDVIKPDSDKYWSPHPQTGVFGPSTTDQSATAEATRQDSAVLEETAWFRPISLEDSDKTHHV